MGCFFVKEKAFVWMRGCTLRVCSRNNSVFLSHLLLPSYRFLGTNGRVGFGRDLSNRFVIFIFFFCTIFNIQNFEDDYLWICVLGFLSFGFGGFFLVAWKSFSRPVSLEKLGLKCSCVPLFFYLYIFLLKREENNKLHAVYWWLYCFSLFLSTYLTS